MNLTTKISQALEGIVKATKLIAIAKANKKYHKRTGAYKFNSDLFNTMRYVMIPRDLKLPSSHDYIIEYKLIHRMDKHTYKFIVCRSLDDAVDCLTMLSEYVGKVIK